MRFKVMSLVAALAVMSGCSSGEPEAVEPEAKTLHEIMTVQIDVDADAIWEIGNAAISDEAGLDPAKMDDAAWTSLEAAAKRMSGHAMEMAMLDPIILAAPDATIADEGTPGAPTREEIQGHMDRDTDVFRSLAESLAIHADQLAAAAAAKDASSAGQRINEMDGVCESCHLEFWYPEQKALIEEMNIPLR